MVPQPDAPATGTAVSGACLCGAVRFQVEPPSLFCESSERPGHVDVVLASLAGPIDRSPAAHVYFDSRAAWTDVRDDLPRLGGASGMTALAGADGEIRPGIWVVHVALAAPDPLAAARFFETLGMRVLERRPDFALLELRGGTHLLLFPGAAAAARTPAPFDLMLDDLDAAHARFTAAALSPSPISEGRPHRTFTRTTPGGHVLTVQSSHASGRPV